MNAEFQQDLRTARHRMGGAFAGTCYLTCENRRCPIVEVELKVREGAPALPFQLGLACPRCREPLIYHALREG